MKKENLKNQSNSYQSTNYYKDTEIGDESNPITKILATSAIIAGGVLAYRKGVFRAATSRALDVADLYRQHSLNIYPGIKTFDTWANMHYLESKHTNSIFRQLPNRKSIKDVGFNKVINDTKSDIRFLFENIKKNREEVIRNRNLNIRTYTNTELLENIKSINKITRQFKYHDNGTNIAHRARSLMVGDSYEYFKITQEKANSQMKKYGYRTATLGDMLRVVSDESGNKSLTFKRTDFMLDKDSVKTLEKFMKESRVTYKLDNGKSFRGQLIDTENWKEFGLDSGIMINKKGKIIDVRYASQHPQGFVRSLANDYQIPILGFNPLRFFGADKFGIKPNRYGILHQNTVQNSLTGAKGKVTIKDTQKYGKSPLLFVNGKVYQFNEDLAATYKVVADNMEIEKLSKETTSYGIRSDLNAYRKLVGLNVKTYIPYDESDGKVKNLFSTVMKKLDIGFQDRNRSLSHTKKIKTVNGSYKIIEVDQDEGYLSMGRLVEGIRNKLANKLPTPYKEVRETTKITDVFGKVEKYEDLYLLKHKDTSLKQVIQNKDMKTLDQYFSEFFVSRKNPQNIGNKGIFIYTLADRLNQTLSDVGLGLGIESAGSAVGIIGNIGLKRFLPIYGVYQTMQYITYLSERDSENKGNIQKSVANAFMTIDLGIHKIKDVTGLTAVMKRLTELTPGSDNITELPGLYSFGIDRTYEEQKEYYKNGMVPIRKGRYWELGSSAYTGEKISYWKPNWYRRIQGDVMFSDSKYGSRKEYFDNHWFTSPIKHFITDRYHYEKKHYYDRPYMLTSPQFENVPIIGNTLAGTIGKVIKPQRKMHIEYWEGGSINEEAIQKDLENNQIISNNITSSVKGKSIGFTTSKAQTSNEGKTNLVYTTSSGINGLYTTSVNKEEIKNINYKLKDDSIRNIDSVALSKNQNLNEGNQLILDPRMPNNLSTTLASQYTNLTNLTGMTGFVTETFITGTPLKNAKVYDTMGYSMSFNKTFWDQEIGGMGGALSEIMRRYIPNKNKDFEYINPIKNTMPSWLPGNEYFTDFTTGDPMTKINWGEGRLPGEGYERLWGINDPLRMGIGSSFIGKSEEDIRKHLLNQDTITDKGLQEIVDKGTKLHKQIEEELLRNGIAADTEQTVYDDKNNIKGTYDVRLEDGNSLTGKSGIMDIKTINSKGYNEILENREIKPEHMSQVNFYLKHMDENRGYIMYVNRDNPDEREVLSFKYSEELYQYDMDKLNRARQGIKNDLENGVIGRGELYNHMDRVRILADVAPYSEKYKEAVKLLRANMTDEEAIELEQIEKRVKAQKEPLRVYDYKFKTANLIKKEATINQVLDDNTFTVDGEEGVSYKFGGIDINQIEDPKEKEKYLKYIKSVIAPGNKITLGLDADELKRKPSGAYDTVESIIYDGGKNINKELVKQGYARLEDDNSAIGVNVRYSKLDIAFGSAWERLSHLNVFYPINTKILQVKSPYEKYKENVVYGESFQEWERPIENFLKPSINKAIENPLGMLILPAIFAMFGRRKSTQLLGLATGLAISGAGKIYAKGKEASTGEKWIPKDRVKEADLEEYIDKLKYVKNMKLFEEYSEKALKEDNFDVKKYMREEEESASKRKGKSRRIENHKKDIRYGKKTIYDVANEEKDARLTRKESSELESEGLKEKFDIIRRAVKSFMHFDDPLKKVEVVKNRIVEYAQVDNEVKKRKENLMTKKLNATSNDIKTHRKVEELPENAMLALDYYQKAQETVYGYDKGESIQNLFKAIPKIEKDYFKHFINAPEEERGKILEVIPGYLKNAMMNMWGQNTQKQPLVDYFKENYLPDEEWAGWEENVSLDSLRVKMINKENLEFSNFNVWNDDIEMANSQEIPIPKVDAKRNSYHVQQQLYNILREDGYENINIKSKKSFNGSVNMNVGNNMQNEVERKIKDENLYLD